jgi:hypothetical protein
MAHWSPDPSTPDEDGHTAGSLRCFACGNDYDYLGSPPHPGRCPACGARDVPPAGALERVAGPAPIAAGPGESTHRVDAADDTDRTFTYWLTALEGGRVQLVRIGVEDALVGPTHDAWPEGIRALVPAWLEASLAAADLELVAPAAILDVE